MTDFFFQALHRVIGRVEKIHLFRHNAAQQFQLQKQIKDSNNLDLNRPILSQSNLFILTCSITEELNNYTKSKHNQVVVSNLRLLLLL